MNGRANEPQHSSQSLDARYPSEKLTRGQQNQIQHGREERSTSRRLEGSFHDVRERTGPHELHGLPDRTGTRQYVILHREGNDPDYEDSRYPPEGERS